MDEQLKRRLVGATVLVALAVIFLPMLLERQPDTLKPVPVKPLPKEPARRFDTALLQDRPPKTTSTPPAAPSASKPSSTPAAPPRQATRPRAKAGGAKPSRMKKPAPPRAWVVRVASLSSRDSAMKLVKRLRKAGLDTMDPQPVTVSGKRFYRVQVGPEASKKNAERHLQLIRRITGDKGQVVRYP